MEDPEVKRLMEVDSRFRDQVQEARKAQRKKRLVFLIGSALLLLLIVVVYQSGAFFFSLSHDSKFSRSSPVPQKEHWVPMPPTVQPGLPSVMGVDPVKVYLSSPKDSKNGEKKSS